MPLPAAVGIWALITSIIVPIVIHLLKSFGVGIVAYTGLTLLFDQAKALIWTELDGLPTDVLSILGLAGVDTAINIIFSAIIASAVLSGVSGGTKKKLAFK